MNLDAASALWPARMSLPFRTVSARATPPAESPSPRLYIAGCVPARLSDEGTLDRRRRRILDDRACELSTALPSPSEDDARYVARLIEIARLVAEPV